MRARSRPMPTSSKSHRVRQRRHGCGARLERHHNLLPSHPFEPARPAEPTPVKGIETVKFLLAENDLTGHDLGHIIGVDRSIAYRILKGTRNLTVDHIKKLSARFAVSADLLLA